MNQAANKTLILLRHAKSSWDYPTLDDVDRPLNARGRRDAPVMAAWFQGLGYRPDLIVSSHAARALNTARVFAQALDYPVERLQLSERLYETSRADLLAVIGSTPKRCQTLMLVGHNPGFNELADYLTGQSLANIATCAVLVLSLDTTDWADLPAGTAQVQVFQVPKDLGSVQHGAPAKRRHDS